MKKLIWNYVLVNVSRTWERTRIEQKNQEMPLDNIESVGAIVEISDKIYNGSVIQGFMNATKTEREVYWMKTILKGMSDSFIEAEAERIIREDYL